MSLFAESRLARLKQSVKTHSSYLNDQADQLSATNETLLEISKMVV